MEPEERSTTSNGTDRNKRGNSPSKAARNGEPATVDAQSTMASDDADDPDDLVIAEEAEKEYNLRGIGGTIPYTEYRDRRLESKS